MRAVQQWVGSIVCFLIFVTMIQNLLSSKKYEKYIRFFAGMILILLVMQPLASGLRLEDRIAYYFEAISFQNDARDLSREILGVETQRLLQVIEAYEQAAERDVTMMAQDAGLAVETVQVEIDSDRGSERYGMVTGIELEVRPELEEDKRESEGEDFLSGSGGEIVIEVAPVEIAGQISHENAEEIEERGRKLISKLRRKVEQYYGLESNQVKIEYRSR